MISNNESSRSNVHEKHEQDMLLIVFFVPFVDSSKYMNQNNLALIGGSLIKFNGLQIFMPDFLSPPTYLPTDQILEGMLFLRNHLN